MSKQALDGVKIVELAEMVTGPYCAKLLADYGAEVIKVEKPFIGDEARSLGPFVRDIPHPERSLLFLYVNTNKLGITLDVGLLRGKAMLFDLLKQADIFIEDKPPSEARKLGLDYEHLKELNPRLVVTSITPFGQTGPYSEYKAYPLNTFHSGGEGYLTPGGSTFPDRSPIKAGRFVGDYEAGISAAGATLCALYYQQISGSGQHVDISKQEALLSINQWDLVKFPNQGYSVNRFTRGWRLAGVIPCKDGYVEFAPNRVEEWDTLVKLLGNPEWAADERLKDPAYREEHGVELRQKMTPWFMSRTKEEIYRLAGANHCPIAPYYELDEVASSKQLNDRSFFVEVDHPETGKLRYPSTPDRLSETPVRMRRAAPLLGEHNKEIYCGRLGYDREDLVKLREAQII